MRAGRLLIFIIWVELLMCVGSVLADGFMFRRRAASQADILQPTQKVYIRWDGSEEKLLIQTKYEGPAEEMVWIVPVPSRPAVVEGDPNVFRRLSIETYSGEIFYTDFAGLRLYSSAGGAPRREDPVEWRQQIGAYDVVLLRPAGEETVIEWLNANDFGMPDRAVPILQDYIREQWWMVAAKIHPDALTDITRDALAKGLLHPLEMTFQSPACLYPLRLTSMAAGPVEELIYIESTEHCEPATYADGKWTIDVFGGPVRQIPDSDGLSDMERTAAIIEGRTETIFTRCLTKLRRVFQPEEMTEDIVFRKMNYAALLASEAPSQIGQGATQYGRRRDPNGISPLLGVLTPAALDLVKPGPKELQPFPNPSANFLFFGELDNQKRKCAHLRSCIWALGEIGIDHNTAPGVEATLLRCAEHENQLIRMEAYIALIKSGLPGVGVVLLDRFERIVSGDLTYLVSSLWLDAPIGLAEVDIVADWVNRDGSAADKEAFRTILSQTIARLPADPMTAVGRDEWGNAILLEWPGWMVHQAIMAPEARMVGALRSLREKFSEANSVALFLLKAEVLCGSAEAVSAAARWIADAQNRVLPELEGPVKGGYARLTYTGEQGKSLRDRVLKVGTNDYRYSGVPSTVSGTILRTALSNYQLDDWYALYLLAQIESPQASDRQMIRTLWDTKDEGKRLVAVDILWLWKDAEMMIEFYDGCNQSRVRFEIDRLVADLEGKPHR